MHCRFIGIFIGKFDVHSVLVPCRHAREGEGGVWRAAIQGKEQRLGLELKSRSEFCWVNTPAIDPVEFSLCRHSFNILCLHWLYMFCKQATQIADLPRQGKRQKQRRGASSQVPNLGAFGLFRFKDFESVASCGSDSNTPCRGDSRVGKVAMGLRTSMNAPNNIQK